MQTIETEQLTGRLFVAAGNRNVTKYPNLAELHRYYPCGERAICDHAGIELELLHAVLGGNEKAKQWLELTGWIQQGFMRAVHANRLSYCHYLGVKEQLGQYISFSTPSPKRCRLSPVKGGVA